MNIDDKVFIVDTLFFKKRESTVLAMRKIGNLIEITTKDLEVFRGDNRYLIEYGFIDSNIKIFKNEEEANKYLIEEAKYKIKSLEAFIDSIK